MTSIRRTGRGAAIGALAAGIALLTGLPAAGADELSDLRANNQLLQQRLDQLAQVGLPKPQVAPGTTSLAGSFPRSFLIPGTDTSIQIGGFVQIDANYAFEGGSPNGSTGAFQVTGVPAVSGSPLNLKGTVPGSVFTPPPFNPFNRGMGVFHMSANDSRLFVETRTPTAWGQALTHVEFDFFGCTAGGIDCSDLNSGTNPALPRLRHAYGTLGGFIAGQNWIPVNDLDSHAEKFDFGGEAGEFGYARAPQVGYKYSAPWIPYTPTIGLYAVTPANQLATPTGALQDDTCCVGAGAVPGTTGNNPTLAVNPTKSSMPDLNMVLNWQQPWGHFQLHGLVRDLKISDGRFVTKEFVGYGGGFSGNVKPAWFGWVKDNLGFEAWAGDGLGHYATNPGTGEPGTTQALATNFGGAAVGGYGTCNASTAACLAIDSAANAAHVLARTVTAWGGQANYQHWWTPTLRSTASFGILHQDLPTALLGPTATAANFNYNKEWITAHANLIWSPVAFINTGLEYVYGHRLTLWNQRGNNHTLDWSFQVKF